MKGCLRILHLEDDLEAAAMVESALISDSLHFTITVVQTLPEFENDLKTGSADLILADFALKSFDGKTALELVHSQYPNVPFVFVSKSMGEEVVIEALSNGAAGYVLKDHLDRLGGTVRRAMQEAEDRIDRKALERQAIRSQKMEVFGQLASGVAHDFNNILAVIMGFSSLMRAKLNQADPCYKYSDEIEQAADRALALTRQLLVFSRNETLQPIILDVNEVVGGLEKMLRRLINENVELNFLLGQHVGKIKGDPGYIGQVLMNLVVNARDAMPAGGDLSVATGAVTIREKNEEAHPGVAPGEYVVLSVSDTGSGMSNEVKERIFEAFYTTKPKGKGTGLGLATCHNIVKQSGGHIAVFSELGIGTTFKVYLPRVDQPAPPKSKPAPAAPLPRGTETLLIVEDDASVRHLACTTLQDQGYIVLSAANGQEGLQVAHEYHGPEISLVITDVIMPQMCGDVMAEWLKSIYPDLKILFTSGYTDEALMHHGVLDPEVAFLTKPYSPGVLLRKVREMLDAPVSVHAAY